MNLFHSDTTKLEAEVAALKEVVALQDKVIKGHAKDLNDLAINVAYLKRNARDLLGVLKSQGTKTLKMALESITYV